MPKLSHESLEEMFAPGVHVLTPTDKKAKIISIHRERQPGANADHLECEIELIGSNTKMRLRTIHLRVL